MEKDLYNLKLHESLTEPSGMLIMRVPGGWIYDCWDFTNDCSKIGTFVPFNNEFQDKLKTINELFPPEKKAEFNFKKALIELGVEDQIASDWIKVRTKLKASNTKTAFDEIKKQILLTTFKPNDCIKLAVKKNWRGFEAEWYFNATKKVENESTEKKLSSKF